MGAWRQENAVVWCNSIETEAAAGPERWWPRGRVMAAENRGETGGRAAEDGRDLGGRRGRKSGAGSGPKMRADGGGNRGPDRGEIPVNAGAKFGGSGGWGRAAKIGWWGGGDGGTAGVATGVPTGVPTGMATVMGPVTVVELAPEMAVIKDGERRSL